MSKKTNTLDQLELETAAVPFFAHLLSGQSDLSAETGGTVPTYHCLDMPCTKKYPSDGDEPTSTLWDK